MGQNRHNKPLSVFAITAPGRPNVSPSQAMTLIRNSLPESTRQGKRKVKTVILLQIVLVSPGTHLLKNHESHSRTNESQLKKKEVLRIDIVWALGEDRLQNSLFEFTEIKI